ncbi:MAG: GNAT family N-acetyltransferase [Bacteroidales bacterium]|nr:GNAT family N-acetyltransferase [Bacteroidales bacterium]
MEIKKATFYDLIDVLFLLRDCITDMNSKGLKQWNSTYPGPEIMKNDIEKETLYICTDLGIARGMINLSDEIPEEYNEIKWKGKSDKVLYINRFAVNPIWKDSDVAQQLLAFSEKYAAKNKYSGIRLDVLDNFPVDSAFFTAKEYEFAGEFHSTFQKMPYTCYEKNL